MAADFLNKGAVKAFPGRYFDDPGGIYGVKSTKAIGWQCEQKARRNGG
jgi:hypothetical protein